MPYIDKTARDCVAQDGAETAGELNYLLTLQAIAYVERKGLSYATINDVLGALEGAKQEFYRRVAVQYEEGKIALNGDVYPPTIGGYHQ